MIRHSFHSASLNVSSNDFLVLIHKERHPSMMAMVDADLRHRAAAALDEFPRDLFLVGMVLQGIRRYAVCPMYSGVGLQQRRSVIVEYPWPQLSQY